MILGLGWPNSKRSAQTLSQSFEQVGEYSHLLSVQSVSLAYRSLEGCVRVLEDVSLYVERGEVVGLVGESGSGKTTLATVIAGLYDTPPAFVEKGKVVYKGTDLLNIPKDDFQRIRGTDIGFVMQESVSALNPVYTVGEQLREALSVRTKRGQPSSATEQEILKLLEELCIDQPHLVLSKYPHQLSGGMRKRVAIAMAVIQRPELLILDEPTTGMDGFVQNRIVGLLKRLGKKYDMSMLVITHDLQLAGRACDRLYVMYAGQVVEEGRSTQVLTKPLHPYTKTLVSCRPEDHAGSDTIPVAGGEPPELSSSLGGCRFHSRCPSSIEVCADNPPAYASVGDGCVRCWLYVDKHYPSY